MRQRRFWWGLLAGVLGLVCAFVIWQPSRPASHVDAPASPSAPAPLIAAGSTSAAQAANASVAPSALQGAQPTRQVSNTPDRLDQLLTNPRAVLLRHARIDTTRPLTLNIPPQFRAPSNTASWIVQARGPMTEALFRELQSTVELVDGRIVPNAYYPNNAWLVRLAAERVAALRAHPVVTAVLPFEPYYKLDERLFDGQFAHYRVLGFPGEEAALTQALTAAGARVVGQEASSLGAIFTVDGLGTDVATLARIDSLQLIEPKVQRAAANDLARIAVGVSTNSVSATNYLDLTGANVLVSMGDTGFDLEHPDLLPRVTVDAPATAADPEGHGTFNAGVIASSGANSTSVTASGSPTGANHRGMAPGAKIFGMRAVGSDDQSDAALQELAAATNSLIANHSWNYPGAFGYDLAAANYDAASRDALPSQTGSQPLLFVFPVGNAGFAGNDGFGGEPGSIASPATSKNSVSVGAVEQLRNITNEVTRSVVSGTNTVAVTNQPWLGQTDSSDQVAPFSGRGNVGAGTEGLQGRVKPDVVAPGVFTVSTRSDDWNTTTYFSPTNFSVNRFRFQLIPAGEKANYSIFVPANGVQLTIRVLPNQFSPTPLPDIPIYVRQAGIPTTTQFDVMRSNVVSLPPNRALTPVATTWFYSIVNPYTNDINLDIRTAVGTTNDVGDFYEVLRGMNEALDPGQLYRYESGTSVAAPVVSGLLALMEEFFEQRLKPQYGTNNRPSPALLKALLVNGARSLNANYSISPNGNISHQGWGQVNLTNSLPPALSNNFNLGDKETSMVFYDQSPTNALTTGQSRSWKIQLSDLARLERLRATLVWTDPPGNPAAGPKLVNNLDLVLTNLDTGEVYFGNDMPEGQDFTRATTTNTTPIPDVVNNVENVFLREPLGTNYAITVVGRQVNVNAVTAQTNGIAQDYALVFSVGEGGVATNGFKVTDNNTVAFTNEPLVTIVRSNGVPLLNQLVGANNPFLTTTNGTTNQWHFYIYTNATSFTNTAFVTFLPPTLSIPRIGVREVSADNATRVDADLDLYVSSDPTLIQLNPAAIAAARKSLSRGGTESVVFTNATPGQVFYIGVKSEDQMAAEFGFLAVSSLRPFSTLDENGFQHVLGLSVPMDIPDGSPSDPGGAFVFGIAVYPMQIRKVVVTNTITHEAMGDLLGNFSHGQQFAVLNNHRPATVPGGFVSQSFIYDDSGEAPILGAIATDGPGSLRGFVGEEAVGVWMLTMVDNSLNQTGRVDLLDFTIEPVQDDFLGRRATIPPRQFFFDSINVPPEATNLTVTIGNMSDPNSPVELYIRKGDFPTRTEYDKFAIINPPGGSLSVTLFDIPPLSAGRYYIGIFNPSFLRTVALRYTITLGLAAEAASSARFVGLGQTPLLDDAVSRSTLVVTNDEKIARAEVGVILQHPRVSDIALTLISPIGKRILLAENRGGLTTGGYGTEILTTNVSPQSANGGAAAHTNVIAVGANTGTLHVDYDFENIRDVMQVFYDGAKVFDTGLVNGEHSFDLTFGPGASTDITIVMNPGNNTDTNTIWSYVATVVSSSGLYAVFTDNPNRTTTPIKFATPPFTPSAPPPPEILISGFEVPAGTYTNTQTFDGWNVATNPANNQVSLINDPGLANTGVNLLALASGRIIRVLPTVRGRTYRLNYAYRGPGIVGWWRGETNANDSVSTNHGTLQNVTFVPGEVGQSFAFNPQTFNPVRVKIPDRPEFVLTSSLSIEGWVRPRGDGFVMLWRGDNRPGLDPYALAMQGNNEIRFQISDQANAAAFVNGSLAYNQWWHVAGTLDGNAGLLNLYVNGVPVATNATAIRPFANLDPALDPAIGIGNVGESLNNFPFRGDIDEISLYSRALSASEASAIFRAGPAGKFDPTVAGTTGLAKGRLTLGASQPLLFYGENTTWKTNSITFQAEQSGTLLELEGLQPGMLVDTVTLTELGATAVYYLPEESLDALVGDDAEGVWTLEMWDRWAGATNLVQRISSWQLRLDFENRVPAARPIHHGETLCDTLAPGSVHYFLVDAPLWANFATNTLTNATAPLNVIYNANSLPFNSVPVDIPLLTGVTNGVKTLFNTSIPPLVVGSRYYLAIQNTNTNAATYCFSVEFDITPLTNEVPVVTSQEGLRPRYYQFDVSTNAIGVLFETYGANGNVDLVVRRGLPLPDLSSFDYRSANTGTNNEVILVTTNSSPVNQVPGRWYAGVFNQDPTPVNYTIRATELTALDPIIVDYDFSTNELCITWMSIPGFSYYVVGKVELTDPLWVPISPTIVATSTRTTYCIPLPTPYRYFSIRVGRAPSAPEPDTPVDIPPGGIVYFAIPVPNWPYAATNTLVFTAPPLPLDLLFNQNGLPTGTAPGDALLLANTNNGVSTLMTNSTPPLVTNRTYYLGLRNNNPVTVTALLQVEFNVTPLTNGVPLSDVLLSAIPRYFSLAVPSNAASAFFQIYNLTTNVDLSIREEGFGIPTLNSYDYGSFNPATANDGIFVSTNSQPYPLTANTWNLSVFNRTAGNAGYTVRATTSTNVGPDILSIDETNNSLCITWSSLPGLSYYVVGKINIDDPDWEPVSQTIVATNLTTTYCIALPTPYRFFQVRIGTVPTAIFPEPDVPFVIPPNDAAYFVVPVPGWPYAATNTVLSATLPVDLIFNQSRLPTPAAVGNVPLLSGVVGGVSTILTNGTPPLLTNQSYFLAVRNNNSVAVTAALRIEFNTTFLANGVAVSDTLLSPIPRYFSFVVPPGAATADFGLFNLSTNSDLVLRELAVPTLATYDYGSFNLGTTNELITVTTSSAPRPLSSNVWNLAVFNRTGGTADYTVRASATNTSPVILDTEISATNLCLTWTSIPGTNYYIAGKVELSDTNWTPVSPVITAVSNVTTYCVALPNSNRFFAVVVGTPAVTPPPPSGPPVILGTVITATNLCLTWSSIAGTNYYVLGKVDLNSTNWVPVSPTITATSTQTTYCVTLPNSNRFFSVVVGTPAVTPPPPSGPPVILSTQVSATNLCLTWSSVIGSNYFVAGKVRIDDVSWTRVSPVITATNTQSSHCVNLPSPYKFFTVVLDAPTTPPTTNAPVVGTPQVSSTNVCLTWSSIAGTNYYVVGKADLTSTNWVPVSPNITATGTQTTYCVTLPNTNRFFGVVMGTLAVTPPPPSTPPVISPPQITSTNLCLTWSSVVGTNYYVAGKVNLTDTNWTPVSPILTATSTQTLHCVTLPNTNRFFTILTGVASPPAAPPAFNAITKAGGGGTVLNWTAPVTSRFQVQWSLIIPATNWTAFTNIVTASATNAGSGSFSFTDDGSQTGGLGAQRFYQLLQLP